MRPVARWGLAVVVSAAAFAAAWWARIWPAWMRALRCAGAVLAVVLAVAGWWAARERPGGEGSGAAGGWRVVQKARAGRDVNMAGRDQTIVNYRRPDE